MPIEATFAFLALGVMFVQFNWGTLHAFDRVAGTALLVRLICAQQRGYSKLTVQHTYLSTYQ